MSERRHKDVRLQVGPHGMSILVPSTMWPICLVGLDRKSKKGLTAWLAPQTIFNRAAAARALTSAALDLGNAYPVTVSGRILEPDGRIVPFKFTPNLPRKE